MNKIILDKWLSKIMNKPSYLLKKFDKSLKKKDLPKGRIFIWSKIPVHDIKKLIFLQKLGFYIVDTNVQLSFSNKKKWYYKSWNSN